MSRLAEVIARHRASGYFACEDGHRECYCGHDLTGESYAQHVAAEVAAWLTAPEQVERAFRAIADRPTCEHDSHVESLGACAWCLARAALAAVTEEER